MGRYINNISNNAPKKLNPGFTIVELLIVMVVLGILAAIATVSYGGISARAKDSHSERNMRAMQQHLNHYYSNHGYYPYTSAITGAGAVTWTRDNIPNFNPDLLRSHAASSTTTNSYHGAFNPPPGRYNYRAWIDGVAQCSTAEHEGLCQRYILSYQSEVDGSIVRIDSRNH